ncbi:UxaA family hydrolase [Sphingomonas sp. S2-65]|uniref:UxaA family hydrolase n=1 Tax=Sphingomonas sp. S2-65 TaxID=2903960 RepID=UPI001F2A3C26|nr:altronate dehydratase family protein [Sphingomonas sp. S2-65]UYY60030.1 altronate dehydratase family protein [Sphingomonas sp. S2-65]
MTKAAHRIDPRDHVATALRALSAGECVSVEGAEIVLRDDIPHGHKLAVAAVSAGDPVLKFGFPIGVATQAIAQGDHVHTHNVATALGAHGNYTYNQSPSPLQGRGPGRGELSPSDPAKEESPSPQPSPRERREGEEGLTFNGYLREDGRAATRNEIWVLPSVGCVGRTAHKIAAAAHAKHAGKVDGVYAFTHPFGCSQLGDDLHATRDMIAALASHPNAGGVLLVGLGCENNQLDGLLAAIPPERHARIRHVAAQFADDEIAAGLAAIDELVAIAAQARREPLPLSKLVVGVKCGGSDGFSGLTANPLVGRIADAVTEAGGTAVLTEIPEIFGAEQMLMDRAADEAVFTGIVGLVNGFKAYFTAHGEPVSENPSPGNIAGGITTLEEKSLGAVQKGGHATVTDVLHYGERLRRTGLTLLEAPGNDAVSSTALSAAGATVILFTTGRGTPLGFPVPTVKIASNTALAARKPGWIDFDAGAVLDQGLDATTDALLARIAQIASGTPTAAERNEEREIALWKRGVTL